MKRFRLVDNLMGWLIFAVAAWTYCSTIEPTASFWDCPEFITTGYKLEVGHPPGAPFFMLTANLFSQFVSDPALVAKMVNTMSALFSAFCILFLYWTISHLVRRLICKDGIVTTTAQLITTQASAVVGALAYCWSDTFWFSAVEGEVYAYSSLFTALVVWLMLKWEDHADDPHSDRWLILIAYMTGLSIGVHLLNLLCLPALVLIYYYRKFKNPNVLGSFLALGVGFALIVVVLYGVVPGIVKVGGWFEWMFVNGMHCSFNTGLYVYIFLLVSIVIWAIWESQKGHSKVRANISYLLSVGLLGIPFFGYGSMSIVLGILLLGGLAVLLSIKNIVSARFRNTSLLCMLLIMIGYSSYAVIVIRSSANTPMDQNSPEDIFTLGSYLSREQYGDRPLLYGQVYNSPIEYDADGHPMSDEGAPIYQRVEKSNPGEPDRYRVIDHKREYKYQVNMLFPRMYDAGHAADYESLMSGSMTGRQVQVDGQNGPETITVPTFWDNMKFFFSYQVNFMYMRYFFWNFAGRQNDIQGNGEAEHGNWLTGISFIDNWRLGDQNLLPDDLKANKGHNVFYCLPLILGLIGLFWQIMRSQESVKQFWVVFFLFFMTGLAIVLYLNQTPSQPRERDYAYAGSFYAFAIWIGLGVTAISDGLTHLLRKKHNIIAAIAPCICVLVPIQMVSQTWDDHDRSDRYTCRDFGANYLNSLDEKGNPIIFTNGDNDTFPLWYGQETESTRTDARVCNLSYLQTDWYIDQMKRPAYNSPGLPISWSRRQYVTGKNEVVYVYPLLDNILSQLQNAGYSQAEIDEMFGKDPYDMRCIINHWILHNSDAVKKIKEQYNLKDADGEYIPIIPTNHAVLHVDKEGVRQSGMMMVDDEIPSEMELSFEGRSAIYKSEMMIYEMLCGARWKRPMYVAVTVGSDAYGSLGNYFVQEGLAYRITPFQTGGHLVDTKRMYTNLMTKFKFGGIDNPNIYIDETVMRMCNTHRRMFAVLIDNLLSESREAAEQGNTALANQKKTMARNALQKAAKEIPSTTVPHTMMSGSDELAAGWIAVGNKAEAKKIVDQLLSSAKQYLNWYLAQANGRFGSNAREMMSYTAQYQAALHVLKDYDAQGYRKEYQTFVGYIHKCIDYASAAELPSVLQNYLYFYNTAIEDLGEAADQRTLSTEKTKFEKYCALFTNLLQPQQSEYGEEY